MIQLDGHLHLVQDVVDVHGIEMGQLERHPPVVNRVKSPVDVRQRAGRQPAQDAVLA